MSAGDKYYEKRNHHEIVREFQEGEGRRLSLNYECSGKISLKGLCRVFKELKETESLAVILGKRVPGRGNSECKGPEARGFECRSCRAL